MTIYEYGKENSKTPLTFPPAAEPRWIIEDSARAMAFFGGGQAPR